MKKCFLKKTVSVMLGVIMCSLLALPNTANADEGFQIYPNTQIAIDEAVSQSKVEQDYLNSIIELFNREIHTNSDDLNELLIDALNQGIAMNEKTDYELKLAQKAAEELQAKSTNTYGAEIEPKASTAENLYLAGVALVANKGCPQTANYMLHAKQANPPIL